MNQKCQLHCKWKLPSMICQLLLKRRISSEAPAIIHSQTNTSWRMYNSLILYLTQACWPILSMQNAYVTQMNACQSLSIMCVYVWLSNRRHAFVSYLRQKHSSIAASVTLTSSGNHSAYMMWRSRVLFHVSSHIFGDCCLMLVARTTGVTGRGSIAPW